MQENILPLGNHQNAEDNFQKKTSTMFPDENKIDDTTAPQFNSSSLLGSVITGSTVQDYVIGEGYKKLGNINRWFNLYNMKYYFTVSNSYVLNKLKLVLLPFRHKSWARRTQAKAEGQVYRPPRDDLNAPDLYLPLMAFVTYIILTALALGTGFKFTPQVFGTAVSNGFVMLLIEIMLLKTGFYLFCTTPENPSPAVFDFISYSGYKFVGACICILMQLLVGNWGFRVAFIYCGACSAVLLRNYYLIICPRGSLQAKYYIVFGMALQLVILFSLLRLT